MKMVLEVNRNKQKDRIIENFTIRPTFANMFDKQKALYYVVWKLTHDIGIGQDYKLVERKEFTNSIINIYEFSEDKPIPPLNDKVEFIYLPFLGEKRCSKCIYKRLLKDNNAYCKLRGKRLKKDLWYKCEYWQEQFRGAVV